MTDTKKKKPTITPEADAVMRVEAAKVLAVSKRPCLDLFGVKDAGFLMLERFMAYEKNN